jgi:hypothetical protein
MNMTPAKISRSEARERAKGIVRLMNLKQKKEFVMDCAVNVDPRVHKAWVEARTVKNVGSKGIVDMLADEIDGLAESLQFYLML